MLRYCLSVVLLSYTVLCISEECVTYNFEDNQKVNFTNTCRICQGLISWEVGEYSSLSIDSPHQDSTTFIKPRSYPSCISSFKFSVTASGIFELNVYMEPTSISDLITLLVFKSLPSANDVIVASAVLSPNIPNFVAGWQTVRVQIMGFGTHEGYITVLGVASSSSTVLVDSFRYIAPTYDKDSCVIYPNEKPTTKIPTEKTTTPDTIKTSTTTEKPTTITIPTGPGTSTTEKPSSNIYETTTRVTTPSSTTQTTSTERPRLSISILLIKIKKFFR